MKLNLFFLIMLTLIFIPSASALIETQLADQTTRPLNLYFSQPISTGDGLGNAAAQNDTSIDLFFGSGFSDGDYIIILNENNGDFYVGEQIGPVVTATINLDTPLDVGFPVGTSVTPSKRDLNVDGSSTTEVFSVEGPSVENQSYDITRIIFYLECNNSPEWDDFCDINNGLTNGIVLRKRGGQDWNIANIKTNGELTNIMYDVQFLNQTQVQGVNGIVGMLTFAGQDRLGVAIRLEQGDTLELLVQDDLSSINSFRVVAEGHIVDNTPDDFQELKSGTMWIAAAILLGIFVFALFWASSQTRTQEVARGRVLEKMVLYLSGLVFSVVGIGMILLMSTGASLTDLEGWPLGIFVIALLVLLTILFGLLLFLAQAVPNEYVQGKK